MRIRSEIPVKETTEVIGLVDGVLLIRRERIWEDGERKAGDFYVNPDHVDWLADRIEGVAAEREGNCKQGFPEEEITIFVGGCEHGEPVAAFVYNHRALTAACGGYYSLERMWPEAALALVADLRAKRWGEAAPDRTGVASLERLKAQLRAVRGDKRFPSNKEMSDRNWDLHQRIDRALEALHDASRESGSQSPSEKSIDITTIEADVEKFRDEILKKPPL